MHVPWYCIRDVLLYIMACQVEAAGVSDYDENI